MKKNTKEQADKSTQEYKIHAWKKHTSTKKILLQQRPIYPRLEKHAWKNGRPLLLILGR